MGILMEFGGTLSDTVQGVLIGGAIALVGPAIMQIGEWFRQARTLKEERRKRQEDFWNERMAGPYVDTRRFALERAIEILSKPGDTTTVPFDELRVLEPLTPQPVQDAIDRWVSATVETHKRGEDPNAPEVTSFRFGAAFIAVKALAEAVSPESEAKYVGQRRLPFTGPQSPGPE